MAMVRVMTVRDWRRRERAMSSNELGRARRKPKRRRMEGERRIGSRFKKWSPSMKLGDNIEIRAKTPYRAASAKVKPGLFVVGGRRRWFLAGLGIRLCDRLDRLDQRCRSGDTGVNGYGQ